MKKKYSIIIFLIILAISVYLRFFRLGSLLSPYWEEVALGFDAYSISQTAKDHHGNFLPLVAFESFGDWKPAGYFYALVPFVKFFGLNTWSIRLPSAITGLTIVVGIFVLLKQLLPTKLISRQQYLPHLAMLIATLSPWAIMFSRAAWEVNVATALTLWGVISFFKFLDQKKLGQILLSILLLGLAMYTYHATRVIAPLLGLGLLIIWFNQERHSFKFFSDLSHFINKNLSTLIISLILAVTLVLPFILANTAITNQRFKETSIFSDLKIIEQSNYYQSQQPNIFGRIFYHRYLLFGLEITKNFLSHFSLSFLFLSGDENVRHSSQYFGQLYHLEAVLLFLGLVFWLNVFRKTSDHEFDRLLQAKWLFLGFWLLVGILPASLTFATPHALRILPTLPVWLILIAVGAHQLTTYLKPHWRKLIWLALLIVYALESFGFWHFYTRVYPKQAAQEWQFGYEQLVAKISQNSDETVPVFITREQGRPAMYWWFYRQTNSTLVQEADPTAKQDQGEYLEFANVHFVNSLDEVTTTQNALLAGSPKQITDFQKTKKQPLIIIDEIINPDGQVIWQIAKTI